MRLRDGKTYCNSCSNIIYGNNKKIATRLLNGISFYQWCVDNDRRDLLDRWDYIKNKIDPKNVLHKSSKKYYFHCFNKNHLSEKTLLADITSLKITFKCRQCNSLVYNYPESILTWSEKNKNISIYSKGSNKKVWWKCNIGKHEDYERKIRNGVLFNFKCPSCVQERDESFLQEKVRLHLEELCKKNNWNLNHENKCELKCKNPETNYPLRYDNEIMGNNFKLIIEVHGLQHYKFIKTWHKTQEEFEKQKNLDNVKKENALTNNYLYIEISYKDDNINNEWKNKIDTVLYRKDLNNSENYFYRTI